MKPARTMTKHRKKQGSRVAKTVAGAAFAEEDERSLSENCKHDYYHGYGGAFASISC